VNEEIYEVVTLQSEWSAQNTPAMERRGTLIRETLPASIRTLAAPLCEALGLEPDDLIVEGRDGTGMKSAVPWVRFGSRARSPSANVGWYCVLLFRPQADGVYLCLSHASTVWEGGDFRPRPKAETDRLMSWGRGVLADRFAIDDLDTQIDLNSVNRLARAYETTTLVARMFDVDALKNGPDLSEALLRFAGMLAAIYEGDRLSKSPDAPAQEFQTAQETIQKVFSPARSSGFAQGYGLTAAERKAVELRAMAVARGHLEHLGFSVRDCSAGNPFDFEAKRNDEKIIVEVKGTTGLGQAILLTHGEVSAHKAAFPNNALFVVHSIELIRQESGPRADGGQLEVYMPWEIASDALRAVAYQYALTP
jgi:hypothetical protein